VAATIPVEEGGAMRGRFLAEIVLSGQARSVPVARGCAREVLEAAGHEDVHDVQLLVSELVSNAVLHSASQLCGGRITLLIADLGPELAHVEVIDAGAATEPRLRVSGLRDCTGRGLWLVSHLATAWGVRASGPKRGAVWVDVSTAPSETATTVGEPNHVESNRS